MFLLVLLSCFSIVKAQNRKGVTYIVNDEYCDNGFTLIQYVKKIEFRDTISGKLYKTFDVQKNNPYNKLDFKIAGRNDSNNKIYSLEGLKINDIILEKYRTNYSKIMTRLGNYTVNTGTSYASVDVRSVNYILVSYTFLIYDLGEVIGSLGTILVLDNQGDVIHTIENKEGNIYGCVITDNGKYLCYITDTNSANLILYPPGYRIIDLQTNEIVLEDFSEKFAGGACYMDSNLMIIFFIKTDKEYYVVYNPEKKEKYEKTYTRIEKKYVYGFTEEGVIFGIDNKRFIENYDKK